MTLKMWATGVGSNWFGMLLSGFVGRSGWIPHGRVFGVGSRDETPRGCAGQGKSYYNRWLWAFLIVQEDKKTITLSLLLFRLLFPEADMDKRVRIGQLISYPANRGFPGYLGTVDNSFP